MINRIQIGVEVNSTFNPLKIIRTKNTDTAPVTMPIRTEIKGKKSLSALIKRKKLGMLIRIAISGTKRIVNKYAIIVILIYTFN
jgi:hypothetical protein